MLEEEFGQLLALGHERRGVEFKGPGPRTDKHLLARVVRAVLGMTNRRDGGLVVVGVEDDAKTLKPVGVTPQDLLTWKFDDVTGAIAPYADPNVEFDLEVLVYQGAACIIFSVHEFDDVPVLCAKDYSSQNTVILRKGACYVRSRHKPETSEIPSQSEMRDLLDLAAEKRLRAYLSLGRRAGAEAPTNQGTDAKRFEDELRDVR
jgi:predicted HTH transcriptional regulator